MKSFLGMIFVSIFLWGCGSGTQSDKVTDSSGKSGDPKVDSRKPLTGPADRVRSDDGSGNLQADRASGTRRSNPASGQSIQTGEKMRPFKTRTWDGHEIDLDKMEGKYVLLDFWASWCGPCRKELPYVKRLVEKHGGNENFALIGISLDRGEKPMKEFITKNEMNWMNVYDGASGQIASQYGVVSIPFTVLIDPEGTVIATMLRGAAMLKEIDGRLGGA